MAAISVSASLQRACFGSNHVIKKQKAPTGHARFLWSKHVSGVATPEAQESGSHVEGTTETSCLRFVDQRWKKGNWDLNMFVLHGKMDWDALITAEAKRRKFLELYPESSTNEEPVLFQTSIIPWWVWLKRSHLPEAELLNGRAATTAFLMAYIVDALRWLDMVGETGSFVCKAGLFVAVLSISLVRRSEDFGKLRKLVDEATSYDKQWRASRQEQRVSSSLNSGKTRK